MVGTPSPQTISTKQLELAQRAARYRHEALSTLAHFIDTDWLREAYRRTRKDGASRCTNSSSWTVRTGSGQGAAHTRP